ncbi:MAG: Uma2 family endonuclease [Anaerolineales bacterium]
MITPTKTIAKKPRAALEDFPHGWRYEYAKTPEGESEPTYIPLTPEEALHPEEGYIMPERTKHDQICDDICDMLRPRYVDQTDVAVFHDLIIEWNHPEIKGHSPNIAVVPNVRDRDVNRGKFYVAKEGTRPILIIEVVSPGSKAADRVKKVDHYARVGVREYVYIDYWENNGETNWEIFGFRLHGNHYLPMLPDEERSLYLETVGLRIGIEDGQVWLQDYETGEHLLTNLQARQVAEARIAELEAQLTALQASQKSPPEV